MEGLLVESLPVTGSLIGAILILAMLVATIAYAWLQEERPHRTAEGRTLKRAA